MSIRSKHAGLRVPVRDLQPPRDKSEARVFQRTESGDWIPAQPMGPRGFLGRLEALLRAAADKVAQWDERGLGR